MQMVREGSNGWTCLHPGTDPMCADEASMEFIQAYMNREESAETLVFIFFLPGDEGASNTDLYARAGMADSQWVVSGPHVMIVGSGAKSLIESYPKEVPDGAKQPWVMCPDTPHAHLMIPMG